MPRTLVQAACWLLGFWIALWLSPLRVQAAAASEPTGSSALELRLHERVNRVRTDHHRIALERLPELDRVARAHSLDMARRGYLDHRSPEGSDPVRRLEQAGLSGFTLAAENIAKTDREPPDAETLRGWLASSSHRRNLLAPPFNATGVGAARAADGSWIYTQLYVTYPR